MEQQLQESLRLFQIINENFNINRHSDWYSGYEANVKEFGSIENDFVNFLEKTKTMNIKEDQRDILWALVFGYRDFITELGYFAKIAKSVSKDLANSQ